MWIWITGFLFWYNIIVCRQKCVPIIPNTLFIMLKFSFTMHVLRLQGAWVPADWSTLYQPITCSTSVVCTKLKVLNAYNASIIILSNVYMYIHLLCCWLNLPTYYYWVIICSVNQAIGCHCNNGTLDHISGIYRSVPGKCPWAVEHNSQFWPAWAFTQDQNPIH